MHGTPSPSLLLLGFGGIVVASTWHRVARSWTSSVCSANCRSSISQARVRLTPKFSARCDTVTHCPSFRIHDDTRAPCFFVAAAEPSNNNDDAPGGAAAGSGDDMAIARRLRSAQKREEAQFFVSSRIDGAVPMPVAERLSSRVYLRQQQHNDKIRRSHEHPTSWQELRSKGTMLVCVGAPHASPFTIGRHA